MGLVIALILLPAAAALLMIVLDAHAPAQRARAAALLATGSAFVLSFAVAANHWEAGKFGERKLGPVRTTTEWRQTWFDTQVKAPQDPATPKGWRMEFHLGLDGVSLTMILLTTLLSVTAVLISWETIQTRAVEFYVNILLLETGLIGVFCAFDVLMFYVFFEFTLIPLYFLVGIWGGPQRRYAANKFFIYTLAGSVITLLGVVALCVTVHQQTGLETPFSIPALAQALQDKPLPLSLQIPLFLAISTGFLIKVPLFPFHTWLPLAHVEAPTAGSVLLAGVLLKLGSYGFFRLCLPLLPEACVVMGRPLIGGMAVIGIIYGSLCALAQRDIKRLVAYSSVAHMGFCLLGLFALNTEGMSGAILQMINHGLSTGALFLLVGMIYDRYHTRMIDDLGGVAQRLPVIAVCLVFVSFSSIGLPGLNGFVGEALSLIGMFKVDPLYALLGLSGVVLGAWYLLQMLQTVLFGVVREPSEAIHHHIADMNAREGLAVAPLMLACLFLGVFPQTVIELIRPEVSAVAALYAADPLTPTVTAAVGEPSR